MLANINDYSARVKAPFATLGVLADDDCLIAIHFLPTRVAAKSPNTNTIAHLAVVELMQYLENPKHKFSVPIKMNGTKHQIDVWHAMQKIAAGKTLTYGDVAEKIQSSPRAVGTACGRNPVPIIVPCHRIVAANGLGGFMGGREGDPLAIKRWLLTHEGALTPLLV